MVFLFHSTGGSADQKLLHGYGDLLTAVVQQNRRICVKSAALGRGGQHGLLQGVASPWDTDAPGFETSVTYSAEQVYTILTGLGLDTDEIPNAPAGRFGEGVLDSAGYVAQMPVCGQVFTGTRLRSAFSLRSAAFTVAYDSGENAFDFTTHGYGHGVGLSQYGVLLTFPPEQHWVSVKLYTADGTELGHERGEGGWWTDGAWTADPADFDHPEQCTKASYDYFAAVPENCHSLMAEDGKTWQEILEWYFPGCEVIE